MKKISLILMTVLGFSFASAPGAQAGIVVGAINGNAFQGLAVGALIGASVGLTFAVANELAQSTDGWFPVIAITTTGMGAIGGIVLDIDATLPTDRLVEGFKAAFPFIDNSEALIGLAQITKNKAKLEAQSTPEAHQVMVQLSREEVTEVLNGVDLSSEQLDQVVEALK